MDYFPSIISGMNAEQVRQKLAAEVQRAGSVAAWARDNAVTPGYVGDVLSDRRKAGDKILKALDLERAIVFRERSA